MNSSDDMDLDSMINNPFQFIDPDEESTSDTQTAPSRSVTGPEGTNVSSSSSRKDVPSAEQISTGINIDRINKNHPLELRMLSLEKNQLNWDKKVDMLKEIVEHQNERIELLEKELDLLSKKDVE